MIYRPKIDQGHGDFLPVSCAAAGSKNDSSIRGSLFRPARSGNGSAPPDPQKAKKIMGNFVFTGSN